jgi:enolase
MPAIASVRAKEILDSRGNPTIQVDLTLDDGQLVTTSVPNGIRHYPQEAQQLLDQDPEHMAGKGVSKAVNLINQTIGPQLVGQDPTQQAQLDTWLKELDGTPTKSQLGANTLIAVSQAILKAGAAAAKLPLYQYIQQLSQLTDHTAIPTCLYGLVNGGQYGAGNLDIQEFLVIPASHIDFRLSLEIESALRNSLQRILKDQKANYSFGELGGFTPYLQKNSDVFEFIVEAARKTSYILARDFFFGIDVGADNLLEGGKYTLKDKSTAYGEKELVEYYKMLQEKYSLTYFEDPFSVKATGTWQSFTADLEGTTRIAGDIITATQPALIQQAIAQKTCNTLVVKPSQIGTISETFEAIRLARQAGWGIVISQRTGETNDDLLADLAVGVGAEFVKFGPTNRGEAVAKYNRLADIYKVIEQSIQEGTIMTEPTQPTSPTPTPAPTAAPAPAVSQPTDLPQNTNIPTVEPTTAPAATEPAPAADMPAPAAPAPAANEAIDKPVDLGGASAPPAASVASASANIPPPTMPPATTPAASTAPVAEIQKTIDNTLAEIGAVPNKPGAPVTPPTPAAPVAPAEPAEE